MALISQKLRSSAKGQPCQFQIPGWCVGGTETTVLCHAPSEAKGMGNKSPDYWAAFGCGACHEALDHHCLPVEAERFYWLRGIYRTWAIWVERSLIILPVDPETAKTRPRKKSNIKNRPMAGTKASGVRKKMSGEVERLFAAQEE